MLYGPAISQSDCRKAGPYQLPCNNRMKQSMDYAIFAVDSIIAELVKK